MKFNIIPLLGKRDSYPKNDRSKFPKWKKTDFYTDPIADNVNTMMMTGIHPLNPSVQIIVLDFDGPSHGKVGWKGLASILHIMRKNKLEPHMVRETGNGGFHLIYICDTEKILRNEQRRGLTEDALKLFKSVGDIDIRANGGLVFWDCKFSDTGEYTTVYKQSGINITSSIVLSEFVDSLRPDINTVKTSKTIDLKSAERKLVVSKEDITMYNCENHGIPKRYFYIFNQFRQAVKDMWTGTYIITKTYNEFRKWSIFWRECLSKGFPEYVVINRLRTGIQPEYDEEDTMAQLKCLKFKNIVPKWKYYYNVFPEYKSLKT